MPTRDQQHIHDTLAGIRHLTHQLAGIVADLHTIAYDRPVTGEQTRGGKQHHYNPPTGNPKASGLWRQLEKTLRHVEHQLATIKNQTLNILNHGEQIDDSLRGSMIDPAEFVQALTAQQQRIRRGEYTPSRQETQPGYPHR